MVKKVDDKNLIDKSQSATFSKKKQGGFRATKIIILIAILMLSYVVSYFVNGFEKTNTNLLLLPILGASGFVLFYIIYGVLYLITLIKLNCKQKRQVKNVINCDEEASKIVKNEKYVFVFDTNETFTENLKKYLSQTVIMVEDVATVYSKGGKYAFLNYTVFDALDVVSNAIDVLYDKIDGFLSSKVIAVFKFYDKPISFVSKELDKLIYQEKAEIKGVVESEKPSLIKDKIKQLGVKASKVVLHKPINNLANGITEFIASESVRVYAKNGKLNIKGEK